MTLKGNWDEPRPWANVPLPIASERVIARARKLTRAEIARLDQRERTGAEARRTAWELLRDATDRITVLRDQRLTARNAAWDAVNEALAAAGMSVVSDDYWLVGRSPGAGAARASRYAACAVLAGNVIEPGVTDLLMEPWRSI